LLPFPDISYNGEGPEGGSDKEDDMAPTGDTHGTTVVILGGGRGSRLLPLTLYRSKPAVGFGGKYRIIDIPLSNCINSGIKRIFVLTQFLSTGLHRHIMQAYRDPRGPADPPRG
jgi:glucose-1-phosphate adenylyltransferase